MKKFYDYYAGATTDADIEVAEEKNLDIITRLTKEMETYIDNESGKLLGAYYKADKDERALMDYVLVCLCGWSMRTLIKKAEENEDYMEVMFHNSLFR